MRRLWPCLARRHALKKRDADRGTQATPFRLWILNHYALTPDQAGGTRHYDLANELATQEGYDISIFASSFNHFTHREEHLSRYRLYTRKRYGRVQFIWVRTVPYRGNSISRLLNMVSYLAVVLVVQSTLAPPRLVLGSTVHPFAGLAGYVIGRMRRCPFVFEVRDLWPLALIDIGATHAGSLTAGIFNVLSSFLYRRAKRVIVLFRGSLPNVVAGGAKRENIILIPNGVRLTKDLAVPAGSWVDELRQWRDSYSCVALYAGAHGLFNGVDVLVQAAALLQARGREDIGVVFVGAGTERQSAMSQAAAMNLRHTMFMESVPKAQVPALLAHADILLFHFSGRTTGSYNKVYDYMASRRPIVYAGDAADDTIARAGAGLVTLPGRPDAVADAILSLADAPAEGRAAMGVRGRRYVEENHDIAVLARRLHDLVRDAV